MQNPPKTVKHSLPFLEGVFFPNKQIDYYSGSAESFQA
jgi:hypothetical protein